MENQVKIVQNPEYYNKAKITLSDSRGMLITIDMELEELVRQSTKVFDNYIERLQKIKSLTESLSINATDIESDQTDLSHFSRVRGTVMRDALGQADSIKDHTAELFYLCRKYYEICEHIERLRFLRDSLTKSFVSESPIEKSGSSVQSSLEATK